jgi:hypothetical protein
MPGNMILGVAHIPWWDPSLWASCAFVVSLWSCFPSLNFCKDQDHRHSLFDLENWTTVATTPGEERSPFLIWDQMLLEFMDSILPYPFNRNIALPQHVGTKCYWSLCIGEGSGSWGSCLEASRLRGGVEILGRYWPQGGAEIPGRV